MFMKIKAKHGPKMQTNYTLKSEQPFKSSHSTLRSTTRQDTPIFSQLIYDPETRTYFRATEAGSSQKITASTSATKQATQEWNDAEDKDSLFGSGIFGNAENVLGKSKKDYIAAREIELTVLEQSGGAADDDVSRETTVAPDNTDDAATPDPAVTRDATAVKSDSGIVKNSKTKVIQTKNGNVEMDWRQFADAMVKLHGPDTPMTSIKETWDSIKGQ